VSSLPASASGRPRQARIQVPPGDRRQRHPPDGRAVGRQHPRFAAARAAGGRRPGGHRAARTTRSATSTPGKLHADKGDDDPICRRVLRHQGSARESPGVAWSPASGWGVIAGRWGFLARLLTNRRLTVRYERHADIVTVLLHLACALICARKLQPLCTTATSPSALRHPPTPGRFRLEPSRAALPRRHPAPA
jgi:hypothetical protein